MKTFINIRVLLAQNESEALDKLSCDNICETHQLSDIIVHESEIKHYPNGFEDWHETHFNIVKEIVLNEDLILDKFCQETGTGGLYELAQELTDKFEKMYEGKQWGVDDDTQYFDAIEEFIKQELY